MTADHEDMECMFAQQYLLTARRNTIDGHTVYGGLMESDLLLYLSTCFWCEIGRVHQSIQN